VAAELSGYAGNFRCLLKIGVLKQYLLARGSPESFAIGQSSASSPRLGVSR